MKMCAKCGGTMKKGGKVTAVKKMSKGGQTIVGIPGYNATLYPTSFKKGGIKKTLIKAQLGIPVPPAEDPKKEYSDAKKQAKKEARLEKRDDRKGAREAKQYDRKNARRVEKGFKPLSTPSFKKGGATSFGMLSVKAGIDKNPKPTAADRIAGAKMKKKMGGLTKKK